MIIVKKLALSNKTILELKKINNIKKCEEKLPKILKNLKIKFLCFYIFCFLFLIFFWYYVSCFNAVYKNTQLIVFKDTLISFGLSLLYPFILYLISSIIKLFSLKKFRKLLEFFYKLSKFF